MKVALVSAAWPPQRCGVGDYSATLAEALGAQGVDVVRFGAEQRSFGSLSAPEAASSLVATGADIVHVQYPTVGYGRSLLPAALPLLLRRVPVVATLHEFSIFRPYRWPWFAPFAYAARAVVFTSEAECRAFGRRMPGCTAHTEVIPIGSNIPRGRPAARDPRSVCYFGLLMPGKGIEEFLELVALLRQAGPPWRASLIGAVANGAGDYARAQMQAGRDLGVALHIDQPPGAVADLLQAMRTAYLPGPGGITGRRGAVLAALENGVQVIGPIGDGAPDWLRAQILQAATPDAAFRVLAGLPGEAPPTTGSGSDASWSSIAARHVALYRSLLAPTLT